LRLRHSAPRSRSRAQPKFPTAWVKIGVLTDLSGLYSDLAGAGSVVAAKMAIDDFQAMEKSKPFAIELVLGRSSEQG
jgi:branched-chain amino acid transport system substrate-binding protein